MIDKSTNSNINPGSAESSLKGFSRVAYILCFVFTLSSSCDIGEPGMGSAPLSFLGS